MQTKTKYRATLEHYVNDKLVEFYKTLESDYERKIATKAVVFMKDTFPECREVLRGKLIEKQIFTED